MRETEDAALKAAALRLDLEQLVGRRRQGRVTERKNAGETPFGFAQDEPAPQPLRGGEGGG